MKQSAGYLVTFTEYTNGEQSGFGMAAATKDFNLACEYLWNRVRQMEDGGHDLKEAYKDYAVLQGIGGYEIVWELYKVPILTK